ncbi:hypothetical protein b3_0372 [Synechococcus phage B3]|nr:hypothetical protein b3_0372 [Synechococcus phage B3]QGT54972.1 hypothetical protein b23_0366 [Synechococcus phage B23]
MFTNGYYLSLFFIFCLLCYAIVVDKNVGEYIVLSLQLMKITFTRYVMLIKLHPHNPITNYMARVRYSKIAKDLHAELNKKTP